LRPYPAQTLRPEGNYLQNAWARSVYPLAERLGVEIRLPSVSPQPYTRLAFEGLQFAKEHAKATEYNHRVFTAFFQDSLDIGNIDTLSKLAAETGLDAGEFRTALESQRYAEQHEQALRRAYQQGISAVPAFRIGEQLLVGVQSKETLEEAIRGG
jgi:predicted DsbA family dithiol-disulfide isomerase